VLDIIIRNTRDHTFVSSHTGIIRAILPKQSF